MYRSYKSYSNLYRLKEGIILPIKYNYEVSVNDNKAKLNKDIFLFRGNRNIHYYFSIKGARFTFSKENEDLLESSNAIYAAVTVVKPNGVEVANAIAPVEDGLIHLKVTEDLIDEEVEVGDFDLVFDLFDDNEGAVTIPKIKGQFHVQERPCTTSIGTLSGNVNVVNQAVVDLAIATQENEQLIVVDDDGKYVKTTWVKGDKISIERLNKIEEGIEKNSTQYKDIANLSLALGKDGLLYIKKQDGTLIGTGVKVNNDTDLSKVTMQINGNTLILLNNGTQIASVDLPNNMSATDVSNLIKKGVSETNYNALDTTDKRIIGAINELNTQLKSIANLSLTIGTDGLLYIKKQDGTLMGTGVNVSSSGTDLSKITMSLNSNTLILSNNGSQIASVDLYKIVKRGVTENTYDTLGTTNKTIIGAINEICNNVRDIPALFTTEQTDDYYKIKYNNIVIATIPLNSTSPNPPSVTKYTITNNLSHATNSNSITSIEENSSYSATISANSNYKIKTVKVTMGGTDITNSVYSGGRISIPNVTGNIVITVTTEYISSGEDLSKLEGILQDRLLVWHDEFDDATLDTTKWRYATHNSGGSEQQAYTVGRTENVRLENSNLILEARKDGYVDGWTWSSGRIDTSGLAGFKYGRLEAKLKYDVVSGAFPAFWTIGTCAHYPTGTDIHGVHKSKGTQWAQNGEIDMFEGRGTKSEIAQGGWYNQDDGKGNQTIIFGTKNIDASQYHVYAVEWTETTIIAYIDGVETGRKDISDIVSWQRPQYIILNMAVGSTGGYPTDDCTSMKMEVDWVRVYAPVGVTEKEEVQSISLSQNNLSFNMGDAPIDVYYTVNPSTAWDNNVNYESSNTSVAEVYGSRVYPKGIGNCKITARATNGVTATINVTVAQNASINSSSITLNKDTLEIYSGTSSTLTAIATPANHTDSILWKSSNANVATVTNGVVTGKNTGNCTITAYSSANSSVKAECSVRVKEAAQLSGHPTSGLTLQLDRNGMSSTSWTNAIDNTKLQWKLANNNSTDIASYMIFDGDSFYWAGANYKDHLTLSGFSNYYDFGESQTVILAGDFTNAKNPIFSNKQKLSQNQSTAYINTNEVGYIGADGTKLGAINMTTQEKGYKIDGCIALRYNKQTLRVDADTMTFTEDTPTNKNVTLSSAFTQGSYPALLGNVGTAGIYFKVVLVYNRVLTDTEVQTAMRAIKTFLNS
jgi:beta-glucanase (GH16 family)